MTEAFAGVRVATIEDEDALFDTLIVDYQENALASLNSAKVRAMIRRGTRREGGIIGVIDGPARIEATIGMVLSQWWYTDDWHLEEVWSFVHPDHRRSTHARRLYEFGKWCSAQLGGVPALFGVLTTKRLEAKIRLAQRQVPQVGALFLFGRPVEGAFGQRRIEGSRVMVVANRPMERGHV